MNIKYLTLFIITFLVAFCSIVYELIYSQLLTVIFGGTVIRYALTIGLFLFFLGVGSFCYNFLSKIDKDKVFIYLEIALSLIGFLGVVFIIFLNSYFSFFPRMLLVSLSNLPIILVGFLSGLELPILSNMVGDSSSAFSKVLGVDYLGSLAGTVIYSMIFYPKIGLIFSVFIVAFFNLLVAFLFFLFLYFKHKKTFGVIFFIILSFAIFVFLNIDAVSDFLMKVYLNTYVTGYYTQWGFEEVVVNVSKIVFTPYLMFFMYSVILDQGTSNFLYDDCLNIDHHVQLCDSWVKEYHNGLVDVPLAFFEETENPLKVLLIGGGDGIATNYLKNYKVVIDQVDIDKEFIEFSKKDPFIRKYNNDSFSYSNLTVFIEDAFSFLKNSNKKYDLILLDLPGLKDDKLLPLHSKEFFLFLNNSLSENGLVVTWVYPFQKHPKYSSILLNNLVVAGLDNYIYYSSYIVNENKDAKVEDYILFGREDKRKINISKNEYVKKLSRYYLNLSWEEISFSKEVLTNSIFKPSHDMLIKDV